jgi:hypothetical protein
MDTSAADPHLCAYQARSMVFFRQHHQTIGKCPALDRLSQQRPQDIHGFISPCFYGHGFASFLHPKIRCQEASEAAKQFRNLTMQNTVKQTKNIGQLGH